MISFPKVRAVFFKEWRDSLRDRRTIFATIAVPVMLWPVVMILISEATQKGQDFIKQEEYIVTIEPREEGLALATDLAELLMAPPEDAESQDLKPAHQDDDPPSESRISFSISGASKEDLLEGQVQAIIRVPKGFGEMMKSPPSSTIAEKDLPEIEILYDAAERRSIEAVRIVRGVLEKYRERIKRIRLEEKGLSTGFMAAFQLKDAENIAPAEKVGGSQLGGLLPLLFIFMVITGALNPAMDLTAGEKERSTLETLIAAPVQPLDIIMGKFLTVTALALLNAFLNLVSFALTFMAAGADRMQSLQIPWTALPPTFLLLLPLTLFIAGLLLAMSSFATNYKEAQVYTLPVYLTPMLGLILTLIPGIELHGPLLLVPVVNTCMLVKEIFLGHDNLTGDFVFVFISTCLYAAASVGLAARVFAREEVLFSSQGSLRMFMDRRTFKPRPSPGTADALMMVALLFPGKIYFDLLLARQVLEPGKIPTVTDFVLLLALPIILIIGAPPLLISWYLKLDIRRTFLWTRPSLRALLAATLLGGSSWILAIQFMSIQNLIWPIPPNSMEIFDEAIKGLPVWAGILLIAVVPAVCEEHLFRGFLQSGLRRSQGRLPTILLVGAFFGAFHIPMFRMPLTATLGVAIAFLAWESRSIWPPILFHFLHNVLSATCHSYVLPGDAPTNAPPGLAPEPIYVGLAAVAFVLGLLLARHSERQEPPADLGADPDASPDAEIPLREAESGSEASPGHVSESSSEVRITEHPGPTGPGEP